VDEHSKPGVDANRREHPRALLDVEVTFQSHHTFYRGASRNISEGGVFVATYDPLPKGQITALRFTLPDGGPPVEMLGEVRWIREYNPTIKGIPPGMGLRFVDPDEDELARIGAYCRHRPPVSYDEAEASTVKAATASYPVTESEEGG
jgi:uncharacterized protein (TIGR02266 family)